MEVSPKQIAMLKEMMNYVALEGHVLHVTPSLREAARGGLVKVMKEDEDMRMLVEYAMTQSSRNGRVEELRQLVEMGVDVRAQVREATSLHWAAAGGRPRQ